ncbi:DUF2829 domain-containing protein [Paenibacillus sp. SYP-B4298]|uniref:DUF2829 domain-containing protein n=1 Tax=Paenibacillus sp. SYP-B4298 TaxID=2996034 RepID=UPI0022DD0D94|nr:DUF2829 domain-containing protein [Paenibacillus sp. SYP-B4298]
MKYGEALRYVEQGEKCARSGWNGKGMFIYFVEGTEVPAAELRGAALKHVGHAQPSPDSKVKINGHIDMKAADGSIVVGWLASQTDMLADDWVIV